MSHLQSKPSRKSNSSKYTFLGIILLVVVFIGLFTACAQKQSETVTPELPKDVSVSEAYDLREAGAFILDVREPDEWKAGHIPDATSIPLGELQSRVDELPRDQQIVVVCHSGNRSKQGRDLLLKAGFTQVTSMTGGMADWSASGYPTSSGD